jgi:hypothetical protein
MIVTYAGAAAAEFSSRAVPAVLQTLGFTGRYIALSVLLLPWPYYSFLLISKVN